jgi:hypothetical protein
MSNISVLDSILVRFTGLTLAQSVELQLEVKELSTYAIKKRLAVCPLEDCGERLIYVQELLSR